MSEGGELSAGWTPNRSDIWAAERERPAWVLSQLRWPVALVLFVAISPFPLWLSESVTTRVIAGTLGVLLLLTKELLRKRRLFQIADLPDAERRMRISIGRETFRVEFAGNRASEGPISDLRSAEWSSSGLFMDLGGNLLWIPNRALDEARERWRSLTDDLPRLGERYAEHSRGTLKVWACLILFFVFYFWFRTDRG